MKRALFLDRDGVLIEDRGYIRCPNDVALVEGAAPALRRFAAEGWKLIVISNQSGVGRGLITPAEVNAVQARFLELLRAEGVAYGVVSVPSCARGNLRMQEAIAIFLKQAARDYNLDLAQSWMIGDRESDLLAGRAAGCRTIWLRNELFPEAAAMATLVADSWDQIAL